MNNYSFGDIAFIVVCVALGTYVGGTCAGCSSSTKVSKARHVVGMPLHTDSEIEPDLAAMTYGVAITAAHLKDISLTHLIRVTGLKIYWNDEWPHTESRTIWVDRNKDGLVGWEDMSVIELRATDSCFFQAYRLAHELLHIYAHHVLQVTPEKNATHDVKGVFWSKDNADAAIHNYLKSNMISTTRHCQRDS